MLRKKKKALGRKNYARARRERRHAKGESEMVRGTERAGERKRARERSRDRASDEKASRVETRRTKDQWRNAEGCRSARGGGGGGREDSEGAKEVRSEERARGRTRERDAGVGTHLPIHMYVSTRDLLRYRLSSLSLSLARSLSLFLPSLPSFVPDSLFPSISASLFTSSNSVAPSLFPL